MSSPPDSRILMSESHIPMGVLAEISKRLTSISDYLSFRAVCRSWRSAATFDNFDASFPRVPWLMYCKPDIVSNFYDLCDDKHFDITDFSPPYRNTNLSCGGWILRTDSRSGEIELTHPIWHVNIQLPCLDTFPEYKHRRNLDFIRKMVLSGSPARKDADSDFVVMVIWGENRQLGFSRPGHLSWTVMDKWDGSFCDVLYHDHKLYAVDFSRKVVECDVHGPSPSRLLQVFSRGVASMGIYP